MYIHQDGRGYAAVKSPSLKNSGLKHGLTCLHYADFFQEEKESICLEVSHITSSQISVSKPSPIVVLNFKVMKKCNLPRTQKKENQNIDEQP